jgi:hypothetical protein
MIGSVQSAVEEAIEDHQPDISRDRRTGSGGFPG